jgi:DUF1680 family protein
MSAKFNRREFLGTMGAAAAGLSPLAIGIRSVLAQEIPIVGHKAPVLIEPFDYFGVKLRASRWLKQYEMARDYYLSVADDDILKGYREAAGQAAPGNHLGGWAAGNSAGVFGQWLQAMSRAFRATGDTALRDKAVKLVEEYEKTVASDGNPRLVNPRSIRRRPGINVNGSTSTYQYEKLAGGLLDLDKYGDYKGARPLLDKIVDWGIANLDRTRMAPANRGLGKPSEWYTVAENFYRAYQWMGDEKYRDFAKVWHYDWYWNRFIDSTEPVNIAGLHAYSHVNTLSSCAMAYAVSGDEKYLQIIKNAYDWLQNRECYATGGYGPEEFMMASDGSLGKMLETSKENFESPCGSWAGFKLSKYLMQFTGEARYGDWIEKLLYNGVGAALPITTGGKTYYYADYNLGTGKKIYYAEAYPCCAGTYFQDVVEYHNLIYFKDAAGLYVNLYVPSELTWKRGQDRIKLVQDTNYPEAETSTLKLELTRSLEFPIRFRVPQWSQGMTFKVNGTQQDVSLKPGTWAAIRRMWKSGDEIEIRIPLRFSKPAVDEQHPGRAAVMRGPVVLAQDAVGDAMPELPPAEELEKWLAPGENQGEFRIANSGAGAKSGAFKPFYSYAEGEPYRIYFDPKYHAG